MKPLSKLLALLLAAVLSETCLCAASPGAHGQEWQRSNRGKSIAAGDFLPGFKLLAPENFPAAELIAESFDSQLFRGLSTVAVTEAILAQKTATKK